MCGLWVFFHVRCLNLCLPVPSPSIPGISPPKLRKKESFIAGKCKFSSWHSDNLHKKSLPNYAPLGRLALELAPAPLFKLGWAGFRAGSPEGSFVANLGFRFGQIQIHTCCLNCNGTVIKSDGMHENIAAEFKYIAFKTNSTTDYKQRNNWISTEM